MDVHTFAARYEACKTIMDLEDFESFLAANGVSLSSPPSIDQCRRLAEVCGMQDDFFAAAFRDEVAVA